MGWLDLWASAGTSKGNCQILSEKLVIIRNYLVTTDEQATLFITTLDFICMLQKYLNACRCALSLCVNIIVVLCYNCSLKYTDLL
jgi:hypothetical protein